MLELSVRRATLVLSIIFVSCEEKDCYRYFSIEQVAFGSRSILLNYGLKQIIFFGAFSIFESGGITKHLMTGPSGNSEFCFPSTSTFPSASPRGTLSVSGNQNSLFPSGPVIKCLLFNHTFYETNFKPKLFTANVECNGTVLKEPKAEKAILFLNLTSRSMMATSCFGSLSTLLYTSDLKWH